MIMIVDFGIIHLFLDAVFLQGMDFFGLGGERGELGSDDPIIKGTIATMFAVTGFGVLLNMFNSGVRKKLVDQVKLKRIMRETRAWQKQRMAAFRSKDLEKQASLNKKSSYMNKMNMEMMQMNMRPMLITFVPLLLIFYFVLPELFSYTVALSPIPLNVIPGDLFQLTCTLEQVVDTEHVCTQENGIYLWAWYFLSSIAFSGMILKNHRCKSAYVFVVFRGRNFRPSLVSHQSSPDVLKPHSDAISFSTSPPLTYWRLNFSPSAFATVVFPTAGGPETTMDFVNLDPSLFLLAS